MNIARKSKQRAALLAQSVLWLAGAHAAFAATAAVSQGTAQASYAVQVSAITKAVLAAHPELADDPMDLPGRIFAHEAEPSLTAGPIESWFGGDARESRNGLARVRVQCRLSGVCLPFYATVHLPQANVSSAAAAPSQPRKAAVSSEPAGEVPLHVGSRALLLIDNGMLHLRIPVLCLQAGKPGSTIRVRSALRDFGGNQFFEATVINGRSLRGSL